MVLTFLDPLFVLACYSLSGVVLVKDSLGNVSRGGSSPSS